MSVKLTIEQASRILFLINRQFPNISTDPAYYVGAQEFFWAGDMKPQRFDVKLGYSMLNDVFIAWDYKDDSEAQAFIDHCMERTSITLKAEVKDHCIYVLYQNKWRFMLDYRPNRTIPAKPTIDKVTQIFRLNAGLPKVVEISLQFD